MKYKRQMLILVAPMALAVGACSDGLHNGHIISGSTSGLSAVGYVATNSNYRLVVAKTAAGTTQICAEGGPDTALVASMAGSGSLAVKVNAQASAPVNPTITAGGGAQYAEGLTKLLGRTQGLAMYRDGMYALCQAQMNGTLTAGEFYRASDRLRQTSAELIALEIKGGLLNPTSATSAPTTSAPGITLIKPD